MNNTTPPTSDPITTAVTTWQPRCFTGSDHPGLVADIRSRVLASSPPTVNDARLVLAAVSRIVADAIRAGETPNLDELLTEMGVNRWAHRALRDGSKQSLVSVHRGKLARLVRVERGLPSRIEIRGDGPARHTPCDWEAIAKHVGGEVLACLVIAIGAGLTAQSGVGAQVVTTTDGFYAQTATGDLVPIVEHLDEYSAQVIGVVVPDWTWKHLRRRFPEQNFADHCVKATHTIIALAEHLSVHAARSKYRLSRRYIDAATFNGTCIQDHNDYRQALRGRN